MRKNKTIYISIGLLIIGVLFTTVGFSSFNRVFNINKSYANVLATKDVRITNLSVSDSINNALANSEKFDYNRLLLDFNLPYEDSSITYKVTIKNIGNTEMKISNINIDNNSNLDLVIADYNIGDIIEDNESECINSETGCKLGISRDFYITVKYKDDIYPKVGNHNFTNVIISFDYTNDDDLVIGNNIYFFENNEKNTYINVANGEVIAYNSWDSSEYIDISSYKQLIIVSESTGFLSKYNAIYDENMNFKRAITLSSSTVYNDVLGNTTACIYILKPKSGDKYLRISESAVILSHIKIFPIESEVFNNEFKFIMEKTDLKSYTFGENVMTEDVILPNTYIETDGRLVNYNGWSSTDYIDISEFENLGLYSPKDFSITIYNAYYDCDRNFIKSFGGTSKQYIETLGYYMILDKPINACYVRMSASTKSLLGYFNIANAEEIVFDPDVNDIQNLQIGENLISQNNFELDTYISNVNGSIIAYNGWSSTDYIDVDKGIFIYKTLGIYNGYYLSSKNFYKALSCNGQVLKNEILGNVGFNFCYIPPAPFYRYVRLSNSTSMLNSLQIYPVLNEDFNRVLNFKI